jgi:trigger factor
MQVTVKQLPKSSVAITIEAPESALETFRKQAIAHFQKEVKIAGFRAGHVPEDKLIAHVGGEAITRETLDLAIQQLYVEAVKEKDLRVVARPDVNVESVAPLKFTATVAVLPEVTLGDYKKIKLKKEEIKIEKEEIAVLVKDIQKRNATTTEIKDRAAKKGDKVEIDFAGSTPDGVPLDGTQSKNHPLELGSGQFIPGFEEGIEGMQIGAEKEQTLQFPKDYHAKQLAGKDVKFKIKLNKIEAVQLPELNDELAKKVSGGKAEKWDKVESDIRDYLTSQKENQAAEKLENALIEELLKICKVEVPDAMIDEEVEYMLADMKQRISQGGLTWEKYLEMQKKTEDEFKAAQRDEAEKRVKVRLIVNKLLEAEKTEISVAELAEHIAKIQAQYPAAEHEKIAKSYDPLSQSGQRLKHQLKVIKLLSTLTKELAK